MVVVDETVLTAGQLDEKGIRNIGAIHTVVAFQKIACNFQYYQTELNVDFPILILSQGKSMFQTDCYVPLQSQIPSPQTRPCKQFDAVLLNNLRAYLDTIRSQAFQIDSDMSAVIESDFVQMRKQDPNMNADFFHFMLTLARLLGLSFGESKLTPERWNYMKTLEQQRLSRIPVTELKITPQKATQNKKNPKN